MSNTTEWSRNWKSSKNPSKQRKYRRNAPLHVKDKLVSANLDSELREELGTRSIKIRTGDRVKVVRGDDNGASGIVNIIDRENTRVYIDGLDVERQDGSTSPKPFRPSNLQVVALNIENLDRVEKYDVDNVESVKVDEEEVEEAMEAAEEDNEMMQRMQGGGAEEKMEEAMEEIDEEELEEVEEDEETDDSTEEEPEEVSEDVDYNKIVGGTIGDAKDMIGELDDPDFDAIIKAEKSNKDRTTFLDWLESQKGE